MLRKRRLGTRSNRKGAGLVFFVDLFDLTSASSDTLSGVSGRLGAGTGILLLAASSARSEVCPIRDGGTLSAADELEHTTASTAGCRTSSGVVAGDRMSLARTGYGDPSFDASFVLNQAFTPLSGPSKTSQSSRLPDRMSDLCTGRLRSGSRFSDIGSTTLTARSGAILPASRSRCFSRSDNERAQSQVVPPRKRNRDLLERQITGLGGDIRPAREGLPRGAARLSRSWT